MTVLPDLEPCAQCDHKRGEHTSTAGGSFNVHPVHYGRCRVTGCNCGEYQPKPSSDQSESDPTMVTAAARRTRVLCSLEDGEDRVAAIAAWAELSERRVSDALRWLAREGFAVRQQMGRDYWWDITAKGRGYLDGVSGAEKDW